MGYEYRTSIRSSFNVVSSTEPRLNLNYVFKPNAQTTLQKITPPKMYAAMKVEPAKFIKSDLSKPVSQGLIKENRRRAAAHKEDVTRAKGNLETVQALAKAQVVDAMKIAVASMPEINNAAVSTYTAAQSNTSDAANMAVDYADPTNGIAGAAKEFVNEALGLNLSSTQVDMVLDKTCLVLQQGMPQANFMMQGGKASPDGFDWSQVTREDLKQILSGQSPEMAALEHELANIRAVESDCNLADVSNQRYLSSGTPEEIRQILGTTEAPMPQLNYEMDVEEFDPDMDDETVYLTGASLTGTGGKLAGLSISITVPEALSPKLRPEYAQTRPSPSANMTYTTART